MNLNYHIVNERTSALWDEPHTESQTILVAQLKRNTELDTGTLVDIARRMLAKADRHPGSVISRYGVRVSVQD